MGTSSGATSVPFEIGVIAVKDEFTVGLVQMDGSADRQTNLEKADRFILEAAERGAEIIVVPEGFHDWFFMTDLDLSHFDKAESIPGPITDRYCALASELDRVLVITMFERVSHDVYYNTSVVIDADGQIVGKYRKNHIPLNTIFYEKIYFKPGNLGYPAFDTKYGRIGIIICHDRHYPEGARAVALAGAEILLVPTATPKSSLSVRVWEKELAAHAIFNEFYVAGINRVGTERNHTYYGKSCIFDPAGELIAQAGESEEVLVVTCSRRKIIERRRAWQFYRDRRPDTYEVLTKQVP